MIIQVSLAFSYMGSQCDNIDMLGRDWWVFPRQHLDWDVIQSEIWSLERALLDKKWVQYYRMLYAGFCNLVQELTPPIQRQDTKFRKAIPSKKAVAAALFQLSRGHQDAEVGDRFGLGKRTVSWYTRSICQALSGPLYPNYNSNPTGDRLTAILMSFQTLCRIPNLAGAIDGSHIKLSRKPRNVATLSDYWCRHDIFSILLQAVCDANRLFWDVCIQAPGGTDDATHLRSSCLWEKIKGGGEILQQPALEVNGVLMKPFILGDSAYPIAAQLLKPFNAKQRGTANQNAFDKELRKGRIKIENAFGMLKGRWQILKNLNVDIKVAATYI
jgi:hypothetical protein